MKNLLLKRERLRMRVVARLALLSFTAVLIIIKLTLVLIF